MLNKPYFAELFSKLHKVLFFLLLCFSIPYSHFIFLHLTFKYFATSLAFCLQKQKIKRGSDIKIMRKERKRKEHRSGTKFVVSVKNAKEAEILIRNAKSFVDIIDVKNPEESTLGASYPWVIEEVKRVIKGKASLAISIGDLDFKPGFAGLKAYAAALFNPDFITASFFRIKSSDEIRLLEESIKKAVSLVNRKTKIIAACYADYERADAVDFLSVVKSVRHANYMLLDTYIKDGKNLFDFASEDELSKLKNLCKKRKIKLIIAGSLREKHLDRALSIGSDYIGFRGILCEEGEITERKVRKVFGLIESMSF